MTAFDASAAIGKLTRITARSERLRVIGVM